MASCKVHTSKYICTGTVLLFVLPVYFLFGGIYIRARFTAVYAYMRNYSGMYVELVYMYDHHNWARLPILLAVSSLNRENELFLVPVRA